MMTLFHAHGAWYLSNGQQVDAAAVNQWREQGVQIQVIETEVMD